MRYFVPWSAQVRIGGARWASAWWGAVGFGPKGRSGAVSGGTDGYGVEMPGWLR